MVGRVRGRAGALDHHSRVRDTGRAVARRRGTTSLAELFVLCVIFELLLLSVVVEFRPKH